MIYICVICMVKRPPLSPLSAEHRTLLEVIVSPIIKTEELKACHCQWLLCANCKLLMQNVSNFQQTALIGIKNLKYLLHKLKTEQTKAKIEHTKPSVTSIKIEPGPVVSISPSAPKEECITVDAPRNVNPLTEELHVKFEPEVLDSEHEPGSEPEVLEFEHEPECDSKSTLSCESGDNGLSNEQPAISVSTITRPVEILPKPATAGSEGVFEVFTHKPLPKKLPYITSIQWKDGVR